MIIYSIVIVRWSFQFSSSLFPSAPCAPQNVVVDSQCDDNAMVVSWSPNPDAQYFHVAAVSNTGARLYCNSSSTACTISNLPCGQSYNVTVLSVRDDCESKPSAVVETSSGKLQNEKCTHNGVATTGCTGTGLATQKFLHLNA